MTTFCCPYGQRLLPDGSEETCLIYPDFSANNITVKMCATCGHYDDLKAKIQSLEEVKNGSKKSPKKEPKLNEVEQAFYEFLIA